MSDRIPSVGDGIEGGEGLFVGISITSHEDPGWAELERTREAMVKMSPLLQTAGFKGVTLRDPTRTEVETELRSRDRLKKSGFEGPAILVWAGHGHVIENELELVVHDTPGGSSNADDTYAASRLGSFLAASGSRDSLLIIDACYSGLAQSSLTQDHLRRLEATTAAQGEAKLTVIASCRGYEKSRDGSFTGFLADLLENGTTASDKMVSFYWGPHQKYVLMPGLIAALENAFASGQAPRAVQFGHSDIVFPNPRFEKDAGPMPYANSLRLARGEMPATETLVPTAASVVLADRGVVGPAGLWLLTGPAGSGKSSCLRMAADASGGTLLSATDGLSALIDAVGPLEEGSTVFLDAIDEAQQHERGTIIDLAMGWARRHQVTLAFRTGALAEGQNWIGEASDRVIDLAAPEWQGDSLGRYIEQEIRDLTDDEESVELLRTMIEILVDRGPGFLTAKLALDLLRLEGRESLRDQAMGPSGPPVLRLLLGRRFSEEDPGTRALLTALAWAPAPGIPAGEVWQAAASGIDAEIDATMERQIDLLSRLGRFITEERVDDEVVYRFFHLSLDRAVRAETGGTESPGVEAMIRGLLELRDTRVEKGDEVGAFLTERIPKLIIDTGNREVANDALSGVPDEIADVYVRSMVDLADGRRALGDFDGATAITQGLMFATSDRQGAVRWRVVIAQAESVIDMGLWRDARDWLVQEYEEIRESEDAPLEIELRAVTVLARALSRGFDAYQGADYAKDTLVRIADSPQSLAGMGPEIAHLLRICGINLGYEFQDVDAAEMIDASARIYSWLVDGGREDLRLEFARNMAAGIGIGEAAGRDFDLVAARDTLGLLVDHGALKPDDVVPAVGAIIETVRLLTFAGLREEAFEWIDLAVSVFDTPAGLSGEAEEVAASARGLMLEARSTLAARLGLLDLGFEDGSRVVQLALDHPHPVRNQGVRVSLAMRCLEEWRNDQVVELLHPEGELGPPGDLEATILEIAKARLTIEAGDPASAVDQLVPLIEEDRTGRRPSGWNANVFVTYGIELLAGEVLSAAYGLLEVRADAQMAELRVAASFLTREIRGPAVRLLHLPDRTLERWIDVLARQIRGFGIEYGRVAEWRMAIDAIELGGRPALQELALHQAERMPRPAIGSLESLEFAADGRQAQESGDDRLAASVFTIQRRIQEELQGKR